MVTHLPPLSLPVTPPHSIPLLCSLFSSCLPILWQVNAQQACLAYTRTHTHAHTQPEVVCNRGFQGGQQDRQFNLRGKEGWWESKREREIQGGGERDRKRDRRGERLRPGHVCEKQTGSGGRGKLYYSSTPERKKKEWVRGSEMWGSRAKLSLFWTFYLEYIAKQQWNITLNGVYSSYYKL